MNIPISLLGGLLLVYLLAYTDFILSRKLKSRVGKINDLGLRFHQFRPLTPLTATIFSLLFWLLPAALVNPGLYLEYRIGIHLIIWTLLGGALYYFLIRRTSRSLARQALPLLLACAFFSGVLLSPLFSALRRLLVQ